MSLSRACLKSMVLPKVSPVGDTLGFRQTISHSRPLDFSILLMSEENPPSLLPVSNTERAPESSILNRTKSTIFSFQLPAQPRASSVSNPSPVAARMSGLCHHPPVVMKSCACNWPHVPVFHSCLFGSGEEKSVLSKSYTSYSTYSQHVCHNGEEEKASGHAVCLHAGICLRIDRIVEIAGSARVLSQLHRDSAVGVRVDMLYGAEIRLTSRRHDVVGRGSMH